MYILKEHIRKEFELHSENITCDEYREYEHSIFSKNNTLIATPEEEEFRKNRDIIRGIINGITIGISIIENNTQIIKKVETQEVFNRYRKNERNDIIISEIEEYCSNNEFIIKKILKLNENLEKMRENIKKFKN